MRKPFVYQKKSLGQVFLKEEWPCLKMTELLKEESIDHVLEIGPGAGVLTKHLVKAGFHVTAVEKDTRFFELLLSMKEEMTKSSQGSVEFVNSDILKFDLKTWLESKRGNVAICGNIPYNISTPILRSVLPLLGRVKYISFLVQFEFAARVAAAVNTEDYGSLSVFTQLRSNPKLEFMVKNTCFSPVPKVHSAVLSLRHLATMESPSVLEKTEIVTRQAFTQRRKMMSNAISNFIKPETNISDLGFPLTARAETISPKMWVHLAKVLFPD